MLVEEKFAELAEIEPQLNALLDEARSYHDGCSDNFCANRVWYGYGSAGGPGLKQKLCALVGWEARNRDPRLVADVAYDVAYDVIYEALPDCRKCGCISI